MYLHTQTLIHSFIQNQTQRKFYVRIMNKGHMLLQWKSTFKKSGATSQVNSPGSETETQKKPNCSFRIISFALTPMKGLISNLKHTDTESHVFETQRLVSPPQNCIHLVQKSTNENDLWMVLNKFLSNYFHSWLPCCLHIVHTVQRMHDNSQSLFRKIKIKRTQAYY